jgi:hypothetical protein
VLTVALLADARAGLLLLLPLVAFGIARPAGTIAGTAGAVAAIPAQSRGLAAALATQSRQVGAVLGVAALGLVVTATEHSTRTELLNTVDRRFDHAERAALDAVLAGGDNADTLLAGLTPQQRAAAVDAASDAYVHGFTTAMLVVAVALLIAAGLSWWLIPKRSAAHPAS